MAKAHYVAIVKPNQPLLHAQVRALPWPQVPVDVSFAEDTATSRTGSRPANLATMRAAVTAALKDAGHASLAR